MQALTGKHNSVSLPFVDLSPPLWVLQLFSGIGERMDEGLKKKKKRKSKYTLPVTGFAYISLKYNVLSKVTKIIYNM